LDGGTEADNFSSIPADGNPAASCAENRQGAPSQIRWTQNKSGKAS
jgi:hypothetical protein